MEAQEHFADRFEMRGNSLLERAREANDPALERFCVDALSFVDHYREDRVNARKVIGALSVLEKALDEDRALSEWEKRYAFTED